MSGLNGSHQDVDIDLGRVIAAVWERKGRILAVTVLAGAAALVTTSLMKPSYKAETRLLIESRSPNLSGGEGAANGNDPVLDTLNVTSQAQLLQSSDLIKRVAGDLKLSQYQEFNPPQRTLLPDLLAMIGLKRGAETLDPQERTIEEFRQKLQVYPVENSRVIAIEFSSRDAELSAAIPNKMAQVYLELQSGAKLDTHSEVANWLRPEIDKLTQRVQQAERKVADYRSQNGLFQTNETNSFSTQQLNDISTELTRVRGERATAEARAENVRAALDAGRASDTLADVVSSQVIQRLKEAEANLQAQISDQATTLLDNHPRLRGLRAQLSGIRRQIDAETRKILASLDNEAEVSRLRERQLMSQLDTLKAESARAGEEEVGLRALEREAAAQRQLLETYLARFREATSRLDSNASPADARIVSQAVEPAEPYFPKVIPIVTVVTLATLLVSCLIVMITELFSGRALRPVNLGVGRQDETLAERARHAVKEPPVGPVSKVDALPPVVHAARAEPDPILEQEPVDIEEVGYDVPSSIPTPSTIGDIVYHLQRHATSVAVAMSPGGDAGSTATVMLARAVAESGRTVILVDLTGTACPTRLMAEHERMPGISDLLCGETAFGDAIHRDRLSDAHIVPQGVSDLERAMRGADRLTMIIDALADAYDLVLVECGSADKSALNRVVRGDSEVILSVPGYDDEAIAELVEEYAEAGYSGPLVLSEDDQPSRRAHRSSAA
jgi:uncharacterized protein involved in exopolysaccharide biosynthesis/Mrp family chromosome partitioning ATPase